MAKPTAQPSTAAIAYAKALLELADAQNATPQIAQEMHAMGEALAQTPELGEFFADPKVPQSAKDQALDRAFASRFHPLSSNTVKLLSVKNQLGLLPELSQAFADLLDARLGKIEVDITVAKRLLPPELEQVRQSLQRSLGKEPVIHQYVDENIIGGIIVKIGDRLIDGSVLAQLDSMKKKLLEAR
jgi:F-type H+-transporting ATPase subunit delta